MVGQERDLLGGGDVQHVHPAAGGAGQPDQPPGGIERAFRIAPDRVGRGGILGEMLARLHPRLVLGVYRDPPPAALQYPGDGRIVGNQ